MTTVVTFTGLPGTPARAAGNVISTVAGDGAAGYAGDNGPATNAAVYAPSGVAVDCSGNIYIADTANNRVRMVAANGTIYTVAGTGTAGYDQDGIAATSAEVYGPSGVAVDGSGNLYIADTGNNRIRMVPAADGTYFGISMTAGDIYTVAGDGTAGYNQDDITATSAELDHPSGVAWASSYLYIADTDNNRIRKVYSGNDEISTLAGNGTAGYNQDGITAASAELDHPSGVAVDRSGDTYIADTANNRIREVAAPNPSANVNNAISTVAGNGTAGYSGDGSAATGAELDQPSGVAVDSSGNLYVADTDNNRIREVSSDTISTVAGDGTGGYAGDGGLATSAAVYAPSGAAVDGSGNIYIADTDNNRVRQVAYDTVAPVWATGYPKAGTVTATSAQLLVQTNENGTAYFVCLASGAAAPAAAQVQAGEDAAGTAVAANLQGNTALTADSQAQFSATSLTAGTTYNLYVVAEDSAGNLQSTPAEVTVTTSAAPPANLRGAGVTIIIHGWQTATGEPPWTKVMQDAIINQALGGEGQAAKITVTGSAGNLSVTCDPWDLGLATSTNGQVIVRVDWSAVADNLTTGAGVTAQAVAAAIAPCILQGQQGQPPLAELPIHLIGHSRGGGMVYDMAQILGEQGVEVDQVTSLDPHPLTASDPQPLLGPDTIDTLVPDHPYANVLFADNYWQDISSPTGQSVTGAYNRQWTNLPGGYHSAGYPYNTFPDHQNIHLMYQGTIDPTTPLSDGWATLGSTERAYWYNSYEESGAKTGFYYSRINGISSRLSTDRPNGGDAVIDGYDSALGGAGARQALDWSQATWPNVITLAILRGSTSLPGPGTQKVTPDEQLQLQYTYRDFGASSVTFYVDQDRNPYNDNNLATIATANLTATGSTIAQASAKWDTADLSAAGTFYVYAKITAGSLTRYLYADPAIGVAVGAPVAPTNPVVNDASDTFGWTNAAGYDNVSDYEYSVDSGGTWADCTANPQPVGDNAYPAGAVQVRVKADSATGRPAGAVLVSDQAFTVNAGAPAAPTNPVVDDVNNTFGWTNVPNYDNVSDYEYSVDSGGTWTDCAANPQPVGDNAYAAGAVQVRVKADSATGRPAGAVLVSNAAYTVNTSSPSSSAGGGGGSVTPQAVHSTNGTGTFSPAAGGTVALGSDVSLSIPGGALQGGAGVTVIIRKVSPPPAAPAGFAVEGAFRVTVNGQDHYTFNSPVTLTFTFDPAHVPPGTTPAVYFYDDSTKQWVLLTGTVDWTTGTITVTVDHFTMYAVMAKEEAPTPAAKLSDIAGHWARADIEKLVAVGAITGYPDGTFRPDNAITRAEFTTVLVKALGLTPKTGHSFADTAGHWAGAYISTAAAYGIVTGYDSSHFGPDDLVTREQMTAMVVRAAQLAPVTGTLSFTDAARIDPWAKDDIVTAVKDGIINGYPDGTFRPLNHATRAEAVVVIAGILK